MFACLSPRILVPRLPDGRTSGGTSDAKAVTRAKLQTSARGLPVSPEGNKGGWGKSVRCCEGASSFTLSAVEGQRSNLYYLILFLQKVNHSLYTYYRLPERHTRLWITYFAIFCNAAIVVSISPLVVSFPSESRMFCSASSADLPIASSTWLGLLAPVRQAAPLEMQTPSISILITMFSALLPANRMFAKLGRRCTG